jgi:hypothetical protein
MPVRDARLSKGSSIINHLGYTVLILKRGHKVPGVQYDFLTRFQTILSFVTSHVRAFRTTSLGIYTHEGVLVTVYSHRSILPGSHAFSAYKLVPSL